MKSLLLWLLLAISLMALPIRDQGRTFAAEDEFAELLERLRGENPGEYEKVKQLAEDDRRAAMNFLRERFAPRRAGLQKKPTQKAAAKPEAISRTLPPRVEQFTKTETINVGEFSIDLCRRVDGAFGLGEIRRGSLQLRRDDFLIRWQIAGMNPTLERRDGLTLTLRDPPATLTITPEERKCAGTTLTGFRMLLSAERGPIVETASWELGGTTRGLTYFDGYRGWHAPPTWLPANEVPETNPKLIPSLLHGTGFQFEHGTNGALVHFHTTPGDRLRNVSRGEALEFETWYDGGASVARYVFVTSGDSAINLWTRAFEVAQEEIRQALALPRRRRELILQWPDFTRKGFRETARECAAATAGEGFTAVSLYSIWDNADFHGGAKNMNVWDFSVCEEYGGEAGLKFLVDECKRHDLQVILWVPAGHLWDKAALWREHPEFVLRREDGSPAKTPTGPVFGSLKSGFGGYFRDRTTHVIATFGFEGVWMDSHLSYAQQTSPPEHATLLTGLYRDLIRAGAQQFLVEGDASAIGSFAVGIDDDWLAQWGEMPEPDLYYGAQLVSGGVNPDFYRQYLRRWVAAGAPWTLEWNVLFSPKLGGREWDLARREVRQVLADYRRVKERMLHRFVHEDGSGYTWTNDQDASKVVWLLTDAPLPDGRLGEAGNVYVIP
jgi:hypothetical protein